jgi:hypothetical protein
MQQPSARYLLIEDRLGESLARFIAERRGRSVAYYKIAMEITQRTGVSVSFETIRTWDLNAGEQAAQVTQ